MRTKWTAVATSAFFAAGPGVVAGVIPWRLTRWKVRPVPDGAAARLAGGALVGVGASLLARAFVRFVLEGFGTPMPVAPPRHLVTGGLYGHVRNPMYLALEATILGQALLLGQPVLVIYAAGVAVPIAVFVRYYEEPTLSKTFGAEYEDYRHNVPGWWPRLRPWRPPTRDE